MDHPRTCRCPECLELIVASLRHVLDQQRRINGKALEQLRGPLQAIAFGVVADPQEYAKKALSLFETAE